MTLFHAHHLPPLRSAALQPSEKLFSAVRRRWLAMDSSCPRQSPELSSRCAQRAAAKSVHARRSREVAVAVHTPPPATLAISSGPDGEPATRAEHHSHRSMLSTVLSRRRAVSLRRFVFTLKKREWVFHSSRVLKLYLTDGDSA